MFRKTFIRLFLITMLAISTLIIVAAGNNKQGVPDKKECSELDKDCESTPSRGEFMILESIGRTILNTTKH